MSNTDNKPGLIVVAISPDEYAIKDKRLQERGYSDRFATADKKEDADRICKAVNNYDALVEKFSALLDEMKNNNAVNPYVYSNYKKSRLFISELQK